MAPSVVEIRTFLADAAGMREPVTDARTPQELRQAIVLRDVAVGQLELRLR